MSLRLEHERGGEAQIAESDGDRVVLLTPHPSPPGSTLVLGGTLGRCQVKVRGCRADDDRFRVEGRFVNLSKAQRTAVLEAFSAGRT